MIVPCPQFDDRWPYSEKVSFLASQVVVFFNKGFPVRVAMEQVFRRYSKDGRLRSLWYEVFFSQQVKSLERERPAKISTDPKPKQQQAQVKEEQLIMPL